MLQGLLLLGSRQGKLPHEGRQDEREVGVLGGALLVEGYLGRGAWLDDEGSGGVCEDAVALELGDQSYKLNDASERTRLRTHWPATASSNATSSSWCSSAVAMVENQ